MQSHHNHNSEAKMRCWKVQNHNQNSASKVWLQCSQDQNSTAMISKMFWQRINLIHKAQYLTVYSDLSQKFPKVIECRALLYIRERRHHLNSAFILKGRTPSFFPDGDRDVISFYFYLPSLERFFFLSENLGNWNVPTFWHFSTRKSKLFRLNRNT